MSLTTSIPSTLSTVPTPTTFVTSPFNNGFQTLSVMTAIHTVSKGQSSDIHITRILSKLVTHASPDANCWPTNVLAGYSPSPGTWALKYYSCLGATTPSSSVQTIYGPLMTYIVESTTVNYALCPYLYTLAASPQAGGICCPTGLTISSSNKDSSTSYFCTGSPNTYIQSETFYRPRLYAQQCFYTVPYTVPAVTFSAHPTPSYLMAWTANAGPSGIAISAPTYTPRTPVPAAPSELVTIHEKCGAKYSPPERAARKLRIGLGVGLSFGLTLGLVVLVAVGWCFVNILRFCLMTIGAIWEVFRERHTRKKKERDEKRKERLEKRKEEEEKRKVIHGASAIRGAEGEQDV